MEDIKKISVTSNEIEKNYSICIDEIPNDDFTITKVNGCIGTESRSVVDDYDYKSKIIKSTYISKLGNFLIEYCYGPAGNDPN